MLGQDGPAASVVAAERVRFRLRRTGACPEEGGGRGHPEIVVRVTARRTLARVMCSSIASGSSSVGPVQIAGSTGGAAKRTGD